MPPEQTAELRIDARWIIPVTAPGLVLERHSLLVNGGDIVDILPREEAGRRYAARQVVELDHHALAPGLVNAHTHAPMSLMRGFADDLPLMTWLNEHIWPAEANHVDEEFILAGTRLAIAEMIRGGTTCFNDMYFHPEVVAQCASDAGIRACVGMIVLEMPTGWAQDSQQYIEKGLRVHDRFRFDPLVRTAFAPHAPYTVEDAALIRIQTLADELDVPIHMHVHETAHEIELSMDRFGVRPLERLAGLGLATPRLMAVHMTQLLGEEIAYIAEHGVNVIHCPQSNLKLASGFCPVAALLVAGVNVAVGTDGAASNNDLDMLEEVRTAALLAKGVAGSPEVALADAALRMATINGARALGLDDRIGSLEPGKSADLIAIDMEHPRTRPLYDAIAQVVYAAASDQVSDVWVAGRRLLENGRLTTLDSEEVVEQADRWTDILRNPGT